MELQPEGWWASPLVSSVSYPEDGNELCFLVEESSFWFEHRNRCILEVVKQFPPDGAIFDVGGGNGCVASALQKSGCEVVLLEPGLAGVRNAVKRGIRQVVRTTLQDAGFRAETLSAVGLFDVIEHVGEDLTFLSQIRHLLIPKGKIYITVPAYQWLWSEEDVMAGHFRRYTVGGLRTLLARAGFEVEFATYFFSFLPVPILMRRVLPYRLALSPAASSLAKVRSDHEVGHPALRRILQATMRRELSRIGKRHHLRWGGSCLLAGRKF